MNWQLVVAVLTQAKFPHHTLHHYNSGIFAKGKALTFYRFSLTVPLRVPPTFLHQIIKLLWQKQLKPNNSTSNWSCIGKIQPFPTHSNNHLAQHKGQETKHSSSSMSPKWWQHTSRSFQGSADEWHELPLCWICRNLVFGSNIMEVALDKSVCAMAAEGVSLKRWRGSCSRLSSAVTDWICKPAPKWMECRITKLKWSFLALINLCCMPIAIQSMSYQTSCSYFY